MASAKLLVDVHTHVYLPQYASLLRARTEVPRILSSTREGKAEERLLILDNEPSGGRPVGAQYWDREEKLRFMDRHGIDISVVRCVCMATVLNPRLTVAKHCQSMARFPSRANSTNLGFGIER